MAIVQSYTGPELRAEVDQIEATSSFRSTPDLTWSETDANGHVHSHEADTWHEVVIAEGIDADGDDWMDIEYQCRVCAAEIHPRWNHHASGGFRTFAPGATHYYADNVEVTKAEFDVLLAAARAAT